MLTAVDILRLPYSPDLTQGGIDYACRSLTHGYDHVGGSPYSRLRRMVTGVAVELAFRRYLTERAVPYRVRGDTPFSEPDRYDVALGGHRCEIKSYLITRRPQISAIRQDPALLLDAPALIASNQFASDSRSDSDVYVFGFLSGLVAAAQRDIEKARQADQPVCLVHALPQEWARPQAWQPLGLVLKSEHEVPITLEINGQDGERGYISERVSLPPLERIELASPFHSLTCLRADGPPAARIGLYSATRRETYLVPPGEWGNIWVYGMEIWLTGYVTHEEFRRRASLLEQGSQVFQYKETRTKNLAMAVMDLHPLDELLERVRGWQERR